MTPDILTVKEAAALLRVPIPTIYHLISSGKLPAIRIGGRLRIKRERLPQEGTADLTLVRPTQPAQPTQPVLPEWITKRISECANQIGAHIVLLVEIALYQIEEDIHCRVKDLGPKELIKIATVANSIIQSCGALQELQRLQRHWPAPLGDPDDCELKLTNSEPA